MNLDISQFHRAYYYYYRISLLLIINRNLTMGYRPPPPPPEFGGECNPCYAPGFSPRQMLVSFSGIEPCPGGIHPAHGDIPNIAVLTVGAPCAWATWKGPWFILYEMRFGNSELSMTAGAGAIAFEGWSPQLCTRGFENVADCHFPAFYIASGGFGSVIPWANVVGGIKSVCDAVGFPYDLDTKFDFWPVDLTHNMFHFYRKGLTKDLTVIIDMDAL